MAASALTPIDVAPLTLPSFTIVNILDYCTYLNATHKCDNNYNFEIRKGRLMFESRFVTNIRFRETADSHWVIGATVKAEMKKKEKYEVVVNISKDGKVTDGECLCPGGVRPACCKHLFGLLTAIEDYSRLELYKAPTERLQQWHQPKPVQVPAMKVSDLFGENKPPANFHPKLNVAALKSAPQMLPIFSVLESKTTGVLFTDDLFYDSTMPLPNQGEQMDFEKETPDFLSLDEILFYHQNLKLSLQELQTVERDTISQDNEQWHALRRKRLTASSVHRVINRKAEFEKLAQELYSPVDLSGLYPIQFGKRMEPSVKQAVRAKYPDHIFRNTGCVISPSHPYLAASPDGLLFKKGDSMLVEVKCILNPSNMSLKDLVTKRKDFCLIQNGSEDSFILKKGHKYYFQIMCQLFCANVSECLFVVYYSNTMPLFFQRVKFDRDEWKECLKKLREFYFSYYIKQLL